MSIGYYGFKEQQYLVNSDISLVKCLDGKVFTQHFVIFGKCRVFRSNGTQRI